MGVVFNCFVIMVVCIFVRLVFMSCSMVSGFVLMFVEHLVLFNVVCFMSFSSDL